MIKFEPFRDVTQGPITRYGSDWGWYNYPPIGEEVWQGDYPTRQAARIARNEQKSRLSGTGQMIEYKFWKT